MENLRAAIEQDLKDSLEGEFKIEVEIIYSDGYHQIYSVNDPTEKLGGQVLYFTRQESPESGEMIVVNQPVVTLRETSLYRPFRDGEKCIIKMPTSPVAGAEKLDFTFTQTRALESGTDIGFIRIYPQRLESQAGPEVLDDVISYS